jgi:hypothetical protein
MVAKQLFNRVAQHLEEAERLESEGLYSGEERVNARLLLIEILALSDMQEKVSDRVDAILNWEHYQII